MADEYNPADFDVAMAALNTVSGSILIDRMQNEANGDSKRWFPDTARNVFYLVACMQAEAGEAVNIAKKIERGDTSWLDKDVQDRFAEEIADAFTYMLALMGLINRNLIEEYYKKRVENERRFGNKPDEEVRGA
jgi:NTP pyrophosphatase (non-canonical NTP hydrolase)